MGRIQADTYTAIQEATIRIFADEEKRVQLSFIEDSLHCHGSFGLRHLLQLLTSAAILCQHPVWLSTFGNPGGNARRRYDALDHRIEHEGQFHYSLDRNRPREAERTAPVGCLYLSFPQPYPYDPFLCYTNMGSRRLGGLQELLQRSDLHLRHRCGGSGTFAGSVRALPANTEEQILRAFRLHACPNIHRLPRYAVLALSQLPDLLELPRSHRWDLVRFLHLPPPLPQLDKPSENVMVDRRRSRRDPPPGERRQGHHPHPGQMVSRSVRVPPDARHLHLRESPLHYRLPLQRRLPLCLR